MSEKELLCKSKEELIAIILELARKVEELENKFKGERQARIEKFIKPSIQKYHHKPGQKEGHQGISRCLPQHIDETIQQTITDCPNCHNPLDKVIDVVEHTQEDIIPARVVVRKYRRHRYWCPHCHKIVSAPYHNHEIPSSRLGPNVLIHTAILKYYHCLPYNKIVGLFNELCGLKVSQAALAQSLQRLSQWLSVEHKAILQAIRVSPRIHIDETGWRLNGKNHWLWAFVTEKLAHYRIEPSRGKAVVKDTLPKDYAGTIISDFYGVYFRLPYRRQKCLVHLLREFRRIRQIDNTLEYQRAYKKIKRLLDDAIRLQDKYEILPRENYQSRYKRLKMRLFAFMTTPYNNKNLQRLCKRFSKFWLDMFVFLEDPAVPWNNNLAERLIRPNVIYRNRSFGNRSLSGAKAHATMTSLIQTLALRKQNVTEFLKTAFLCHRQGDMKPLFSKS
jgi:transposase